jgi:hypothetical protein
MKSVAVSLLLIMVMAAYLVIPVIPVIHYLINKDYIAKNLCINKDKPKSCCKGKCHMVKQLQKTNKSTDSDPQNTGSKVQQKEPNEFIISRTCSYTAEITTHKYIVNNILAFNQLACSAIFVPPKLSSAFSALNDL